MDEMMRYIFGTLQNSENGLRFFYGNLKKQTAFNRCMLLLGSMLCMHTIAQWTEIKWLKGELKSLQEEIKMLKNMEGGTDGH